MKIRIIQEPSVRVTGYKRNNNVEYEIVIPLIYDVKLGSESFRFSVEEGFKYDSATIPVLARLFFDKSSKPLLYASASHDEDYSYAIDAKRSAVPDVYGSLVILSRKEIDQIFRELLILLGFNKTLAYLFYYSVRVFGGRYFRK